MIERHESCIGLSLPAIGGYKIEIWFCPPYYEIKKHKHPNQDIKLIFLLGHNTTFRRERPSADEPIVAERSVKLWSIRRTFNILRGDYHSFSVSSWPLVFLSFEKWYCKPTSAAKDFQLK